MVYNYFLIDKNGEKSFKLFNNYCLIRVGLFFKKRGAFAPFFLLQSALQMVVKGIKGQFLVAIKTKRVEHPLPLDFLGIFGGLKKGGGIFSPKYTIPAFGLSHHRSKALFGKEIIVFFFFFLFSSKNGKKEAIHKASIGIQKFKEIVTPHRQSIFSQETSHLMGIQKGSKGLLNPSILFFIIN